MEYIKSNIVITDPVLGDENSLVVVRKQTWLETYPNGKYKIFKEDILLKDFDSKEKIKNWQELIKNNGKEGSYLYLAKDEEKVIGFCLVVKKRWPKRAENDICIAWLSGQKSRP